MAEGRPPLLAASDPAAADAIIWEKEHASEGGEFTLKVAQATARFVQLVTQRGDLLAILR